MAILGRPRAFDRDDALNAALGVFWQKGYLATSMADLCEAMGIRSPSVYAAFGSKESLYLEAVGRYTAEARVQIWNLIGASATVREGVRKALLAAAKIMSGEINPSGCMVNLMAGDECPGAIPQTVREARLDGLNALRNGIQRAIAAGELPRSTNVDRLSRFYLGVVQGMAIQGRDGASRAELAGMSKIAMAAWPEP